MVRKIVSFVFFANYFVGLLAVALSLETMFQLRLPFNAVPYYILIFCATVFYYTIAYSIPPGTAFSSNPRTEWYRTHYSFTRISQYVLFTICTGIAGWFLIRDFNKLLHLPLANWLLLLSIPGAAILYYGLLPKSFISFNLRNTGWLKAFVIGFVWAGFVNVFPITMLRIEQGIVVHEPIFMFWLFVKNWMFCTVNAIMFDMKDYEDDANIQLKTFAVRIGLSNTIVYVLVPLLLIGLLSFLSFAFFQRLSTPTLMLNLLPFVCLLGVAFALQKPKSVLFYLIVIDGLLLVKAICGITGSFFTYH
ncbi:UbiA family prenyltransferase [Dyadobacter alkalitolerans]|uniref:UbiA family prenyltransferase n=1 Tax=Dyadobacter alkalitolerans TaxID=492736 RepID=UPI0003FF3061|nr:UbiA family prenyltransferase [Dyadobacter alkalitolerans]